MTQEEEIARLKKQLSELVERFSEVVEHLGKAEARESQQLAQLSAMPSTITPGVAKRRPRWSSIASSTVQYVRMR